MTNMTTLLLLRRRSNVPSPRSRCLEILNSSGNLASLISSMNLSFISASKQYVHLVYSSWIPRPLNLVQLCCTSRNQVQCCIPSWKWSSDVTLFSPNTCVKLLEKKKRVQLKDMGEDLECLCQIMRTVGPRLDHAKAKVAPPNDKCCDNHVDTICFALVVLCEMACLQKLQQTLNYDNECRSKT